MRLKPVNDKIVVKPMEKKEDRTTSSGIILPDIVSQGALVEGKVIEVSKGMYSTTGTIIPLPFKVGDIILYSKHTHSQEYNLDGEKLLIMGQQEVLSILEDGE